MLCSDCLRDGTGLSLGTVSSESSPPVGTLPGGPELTSPSQVSERTGAAWALSPRSQSLAPQGAAPHARPTAGGLAHPLARTWPGPPPDTKPSHLVG